MKETVWKYSFRIAAFMSKRFSRGDKYGKSLQQFCQDYQHSFNAFIQLRAVSKFIDRLQRGKKEAIRSFI